MPDPKQRTEAELDAEIDAARRHPDWAEAYELGEQAADRKGILGWDRHHAAACFAVGTIGAWGAPGERAAKIAAAGEAAATAERERMMAIFDLRDPGPIAFHNTLIFAAMHDGISTAGDVAAKILDADNQMRKRPN